MRDFNFFSPYIRVNRTSSKKKLSVILLAIMVIASVAGPYFYYYSKVQQLEKELATMEGYLYSPEIAKNLEQVEELRKKVELSHQYYDAVKKTYDDINSLTVINSELLLDIAQAVPEDMFLKSISLSPLGFTIEGISKTRTSIAEFEHNLYQLDQILRVHVSTISFEGEESVNYSFQLQSIFH